MSAHPTETSEFRIVVGVDGSEGSAAAVRYAAAQADRTGTGLHLVHVVPDYLAMSPMLPLVPSELEETGRAILARASEQAAQALGPERITSTLLTGARIDSLVRAAERAGLIVLGREAHSAVARLVTGATTIGVAARSTCPTIAVPPAWSSDASRPVVAVGLKTTAHSRALLQRGFALAAQRGAVLVLIHAWELPSGYDDIIVGRTGEHEWAEHVRAELEPHLGEWRAAFPDVDVEVRVVHGQPARVLRDASGEADLLMLVRRPHAFPGGHLGGTGRLLLRESACPVEVVPLGAGAGVELDLDLDLEREGRMLR